MTFTGEPSLSSRFCTNQVYCAKSKNTTSASSSSPPKKDGDPSDAEACRADAAANAKDGEGRDYPSAVLGHSTRPSRREDPLAVDEHVMLENISKATDIYEAALEALVELPA